MATDRFVYIVVGLYAALGYPAIKDLPVGQLVILFPQRSPTRKIFGDDVPLILCPRLFLGLTGQAK